MEANTMLLNSTFLLHKPPSTTPTSFLRSSSRPRLIPPLQALNTNDNNSSNSNDASQNPPTPSTPQTVQIRIRRGSRKRARQQQDMNSNSTSTSTSSLSGSRPSPSPPKDWDSMTIGEKAVELYVGEKGLLFWLNKFAYASIFVIIGCMDSFSVRGSLSRPLPT
ncbi:endoglucanase 2-like protein isoform X1 [Cinnamomum micranthum f. kanehirae]|uniref:Endoglucanase 2-like protein isoform X1 n=1 Tax=Cinnamomum micranthum f. kanehirae TaxID=337451 RepID=A0A443NTA4_9MAGN|nr:endoglucanase 2-like protein isoform X1 [Cinnamomum micranthum f. kanehirae]